MNWKQIYARKKHNEERILKTNSKVPDTSGIYILTRYEQDFQYAYIGQAKNLLSRLADHLSGYQHIDLSLKKHGLYNENNTTGWEIDFIECNNLDEMEQNYIKKYAKLGYQLYNHTSGSQSKGKKQLGHEKERKGYLQGKHQGEIATLKRIKQFFDKYIDAVIKGKETKLKARKLKEFETMLKEITDGNEETRTNKGDER